MKKFKATRFKAILFALLLLCGVCAIGCGSNDEGVFFNGVQKFVTSLAISPKPVTRTVGQTQQFTATVTATDGTTGDASGLVTWTSSNPAVVSISNTGLATANAAGSAVITASGSGFTDTAAFTVTGTGTAVNLIALDSTGTGLVRFTSTNPGAPTNIPVTGVNAGETLVGIDVRPQNRYLYGLGFNNATGAINIYAINPDNGVANQVGSNTGFVTAAGAARPVSGTAFGFDFNPTVDRIRVVTNTGQDFRLDPNSGAAIDGDGGNVGVQMDGNINGPTTTVDAAAYTNNAPNQAFTTLYTLDGTTNSLYIQNAPNSGTQTLGQALTVGGTPLDFSEINGFDIPTGINVAANNAVATGSGLAALTVGGSSNLYSINLTNGQSTLLGIANANLRGLTILPDAASQPALALNGAGTSVLRTSVNPLGTVTAQAITGVAAGEALVGLDFRPATGQLYGLGVNFAADNASVYIIDPQTGAASLPPGAVAGGIAFVDNVGAVIDLPDPAATGYGVDFNPTVDRLRVTIGAGGNRNFRVNQLTGTGVDGNTGIVGTQPDGNIPAGNSITAVAYTNSFAGATATTLYTLDDTNNRLQIQNPPNDGTQTLPLAITLSGAALDFSGVNGFDITRSVTVAGANAAATGSGTAVLTVGGTTGVYNIDLANGFATLLGNVGSWRGFTLGN